VVNKIGSNSLRAHFGDNIAFILYKLVITVL